MATFFLTDCQIYFKIDRVQAINDINKLVSQKSELRYRLNGYFSLNDCPFLFFFQNQ